MGPVPFLIAGGHSDVFFIGSSVVNYWCLFFMPGVGARMI